MFSLLSLCVLIFSSGTVEKKSLNSRLKSIAVHFLLDHQCYLTVNARTYRPEGRSDLDLGLDEVRKLLYC